MTQPLAYQPEPNQMYQILCKYGSEPYEHCDYAANHKERTFLINEYRLAYGAGWKIRSYILPKKYWPSNNTPK